MSFNFDSRRDFLKTISGGVGATLVLPSLVGCSKVEDATVTNTLGATNLGSTDPLNIPLSRPSNWNPIEFNLKRGMAGAVPESYRASISGADGPLLHIGKHTPFIAPVDKAMLAQGFIALMIGDPARGYARHPSSATHSYDWISITKNGEATAYRSNYAAWPTDTNLLVLGGGDITASNGVNTIYLASLPPGTKPGDTIRVVGHCNTHGEYVDFLQL